MDYLTTHTSLSPIRCEFTPGFVNYKKGCTRLTATSDKVYQLLAHGPCFSPGTPSSSTTKTGLHDITEILLKVALNTKNLIWIFIWFSIFIFIIKLYSYSNKLYWWLIWHYQYFLVVIMYIVCMYSILSIIVIAVPLVGP